MSLIGDIMNCYGVKAAQLDLVNSGAYKLSVCIAKDYDMRKASQEVYGVVDKHRAVSLAVGLHMEHQRDDS